MKIVGFPNLGNTCYVNSVLQSFIYNKDFQEFINKSEYDNLKQLVKLVNGEECNFDMDAFINSFEQFKRFEQQDAHEFITIFLDKFNFEKENIYHGQTKTTIICDCCKNIKDVFETFNSINLDINKNISESFKTYLKSEINDDPDNLYFCDTCKDNKISKKKISLSILPKNLIIVIKRYTLTSLEKIEDTLYINLDSEIKTYKLKSIINHYGNFNYGHYTATLPEHGVSIDDNQFNNLFDIKNAYILFYSS